MRLRPALRIARIYGIDIALDQSWFVISILMVWNFRNTFRRFPDLRGITEGEFWTLGFMGALMFFVSLLAHELSHALVAKKKGIEVAAITLFIFGGVAYLKTDPKKPGDEFQIAAAGPLLSFALAGLFFGIRVLSTLVGQPSPAAIFHMLAVVNLTLAVFNLVPGFPLDGGRILRAAVWKMTGNVVKATRAASFGGYAVATLLVGGGIWLLGVERELWGLWWIVIGAFLAQAAQGSYQQVLIKSKLDRVKVEEIMTREPVVMPPNISLSAAVDSFFVRERHAAYPVVSPAGMVEGILTFQQVQSNPQEMWPRLTVRQVMVPLHESITASPDESATAVLQRLAENPTGRFLVMSDGSLVGIVTASDLARRLRSKRRR